MSPSRWRGDVPTAGDDARIGPGPVGRSRRTVRVGAEIVRRHPWGTASVAAACAGLLAFALIYFAPQDLFRQTSVYEPLPTVTATASTGRPTAGTRPAVTVLGQGTFRTGEHNTSGTARLLLLRDGRRLVRLERLDTSNGPAVRVWLSAAPAGAGDDTVRRSAHLDVGGLKANHGNQNYRVPDGAALSGYRSVVIWCRRFDVVFGSAPLIGEPGH